MWLAFRLTFVFGLIAFLPGLTQCSQTCLDVDEQGNPIEFPCVICSERDTDPCTADTWRLPEGSTCDISQQPILANGEACGDQGVPGVCVSAICEPTPVLGAGSGSTTWHASTSPPGGGSMLGEGCFVDLSVIPEDLSFDTFVTLNVPSDGPGSVVLGYQTTLQNVLLPSLAQVAEYSGASFSTTLSGAIPGQATHTAVPSATGQPLANYLSGTNPGLS